MKIALLLTALVVLLVVGSILSINGTAPLWLTLINAVTGLSFAVPGMSAIYADAMVFVVRVTHFNTLGRL